jgi:hypothetical protein
VDQEDEVQLEVLEQVEEAQVALAIARSMDMEIKDGKPLALSNEEMEKRKQLAAEQKSLEEVLQRKEEEQWQKDAAELGILPLEAAKQDKSLTRSRR